MTHAHDMDIENTPSLIYLPTPIPHCTPPSIPLHRLGSHVSGAERGAHISRLLRILELEPVKNRTVGSLSHGELKRLTVGVELAASPSLLFLGG